MDRIINVKVAGSHLTKDSKNAGTRGEANVTYLRITFDGGWNDDFDKKVIFLDARGLNPVVIDLLPTLAEDDTTYLVPIPEEPLLIAGELTFVIEGRKVGKIQKSLADTLEVKDSPDTSNAGQPVAPTPDELTQVRQGIDEIKADIIEVRGAKAILEETAERAEEAEDNAKGYSDLAMSAVGKTSYIGENGNWYAWSTELGDFYDTGTRAQAGSMVYVGDNPPDDADVWIKPTGKPNVYTSAEVDARITEELEPYAKTEQLGAYATKEELKPLATKSELTPLATKEELTPLATKSELSPLARRDELSVYAKKDDLSIYAKRTELDSYATKSDISVFARRTDLDAYATKAQLASYVTSEDLNTIVATLRAEMSTTPTVKTITITLNAADWIEGENMCYQVVHNDAFTQYSKVDLQPTVEQLAIFYEKDISFVTANVAGTVTVYCIGVKPSQNYVMQATITEVERNG